MKSIKTILSLSLGLASVGILSAEEVIQIHPRFDSGRLRTNTILDGQSFNQWTNGTGSNWANNVGWNTNGIWYSFIRMTGTRFEGQTVYGMNLAELHGKMETAGEIILRGDVVWLERNPDFPVQPGVDLAVYLVPGLEIPEGQFPTFNNTWPWNYANATKVASVSTAEMVPLRASFNAAEMNPVTERAQMAYNLQIDITAGVQAAIDAGTLTPTTPWGVVFFPEEMETQLNTPNNPQWVDQRGTVLSGAYWEFVLSEGNGTTGPATWAGYDVSESGWVDTGDFLGLLFIAGDFVFSLNFNRWLYLPEDLVTASGTWVYLFR